MVQIPAEERFPDLVYVEDPAVVLDGTALITQMAPPTRAPEILVMQPVLEKMGYRIVTMKEPGAYLDGGDVMFTGREFLVGLSERTNQVSGPRFTLSLFLPLPASLPPSLSFSLTLSVVFPPKFRCECVVE